VLGLRAAAGEGGGVRLGHAEGFGDQPRAVPDGLQGGLPGGTLGKVLHGRHERCLRRAVAAQPRKNGLAQRGEQGGFPWLRVHDARHGHVEIVRACGQGLDPLGQGCQPIAPGRASELDQSPA